MKFVVKILLLFLLLASYSNFLPVWHWAQDINRNFIPLYLLINLVILFFLVFFGFRQLGRNFTLAVAIPFAFFSISFVSKLLPLYSSPDSLAKEERVQIKKPESLLVAFTVIKNEDEMAKALATIKDQRPQLAALIVSTHLSTEEVLPVYPHTVVVENQKAQLIVLSRIPFSKNPVLSLGDDLHETVLAEIQTESGAFKLGLFNLPAALSAEDFRRNKIILRRFAMQLRHSDENVIIFSDMKVSPFSSLYGGFAYAAKLNSAVKGFGFPATGSTCIYPLTSCTHLLYKGAVQMFDMRSVDNVLYSEVRIGRGEVQR